MTVITVTLRTDASLTHLMHVSQNPVSKTPQALFHLTHAGPSFSPRFRSPFFESCTIFLSAALQGLSYSLAWQRRIEHWGNDLITIKRKEEEKKESENVRKNMKVFEPECQGTAQPLFG